MELKLRCRDLDPVAARCETLGARFGGVLLQTDCFFHAPQARLKLRTFGDGTGELIAYHRPDAAEIRGSDYLIYRTNDPADLAEALTAALGLRATVRKRRRLYLHGATRIHLDEVEGLGMFVELETVLSGQSDDEGRAELDALLAALGLVGAERVPQAYVDLLPGAVSSGMV
jgi:predicted adenylyl cyclase CyaB